MVHKGNPSDLFIRWFMLVYLPLGLLGLQVALLPFGLLPGWMVWSLLALALYSLVAVRLLIERKRSGLGIPLPRKFLFSVAILSAMGLTGVALFVFGMERLDTSGGVNMIFLGGCLMILSVAVPAFRFVDIALRKSGRVAGRLLGRSTNRQARPVRRSSTPRAPSRAKQAPGTASGQGRPRTAKKRPNVRRAPPVLLGRLGAAARAARSAAQNRQPGKRRAADRPSRSQTGPLASLAVPPSPPREP